MPNTIELYANNASTTLAGSANNTVTTLVLQSGAGALFPSPNNTIGEYAKATLQDFATGLRNEIVYITARTGDVLTVIRGQDGSSAQTWSAGDKIFEGVTAATLSGFVQPSKLQSGQYVYSDATGSTTAYTATLTPAIATVNAGMVVRINTNSIGTNTTTTPTLNVNDLGAFTIVKQGGALAVSDMPKLAQLQYDSTLTQWVLLNPVQIDYSQLLPIGSIFYVPDNVVPSNCLRLDGAAKSRTTYAALFKKLVTDVGFTAQTFTVTIASPAVFTKSSHGLTNGSRLRLTTTGALPTGLSTGVDYFVNKINDNTFRLSTVIFGVSTPVTTTGTQSGVHSYTQSLYGLGDGSTTFNVPLADGMFIRSFSNGGTFDNTRGIGTLQKGTLEARDIDGSGGLGVHNASTVEPSTSVVNREELGLDVPLTTSYLASDMDIFVTSTSGQNFGTAPSYFGVMRPDNIAFLAVIKAF